MMKQRYHIVIEDKHDRDENRTQFYRALSHIGIKASADIITGKVDLFEYHYFLELSKYDLLFLKLSCPSGRVVNVDEWEKHNGKIDLSVA